MARNEATSHRPWTVHRGHGPLVATAVHGGHELRPEVARYMALPDDIRRLEEDPYTGEWAILGDSAAVAHRSRFAFDLNRDRDGAVYREPGDAWGLEVWRQPLPDDVAEASRALHDRFYEELHELAESALREWGSFVVMDIHSYNHRRNGPDAPPADQAGNPDINISSGPVDRGRWGALLDHFIDEVGGHEVGDRLLDVRENVRFRGAHLVRWLNSTFGGAGCAFAVEVKKIYMDEHTGELYPVRWKDVHRALEAGADVARQHLAA